MATHAFSEHAMLAPSYIPETKHKLLAELSDGLESNALSWLSGYFAGVAQGRQQSGRSAPPSIAAVADTQAARQLTIVYGSQSGKAKRIAESIPERTGALGLNTRLLRADPCPTRQPKNGHP